MNMTGKSLRWIALSTPLALVAVSSAGAAMRVVATTSEYSALATAIGGDRVEVTTIAKPTEDPHFVDARPSQIVAMHRAAVLIEGGAELEAGWLPPLLEGARNARILAGAPGRIVASQGIQLIDIPTTADRSQGDSHLAGNPHFMLDPQNAKVVAQHIARTLAQVDEAGASTYQRNLAAFESALDVKLKEWMETMAPFSGRKIVTYHPTWRYFAHRFGLDSSIFLEPKPGIPPSPPHLARVIEQMASEEIRVLLVEPYQPRKTAESVAAHNGAAVIEVCQFPGAIAGTDTYLQLIDVMVNRISQALAAHH